MKQRLKFIFALMHSPEVLIFDEPTSNLDEEGKKVVYDIVREEGKIKDCSYCFKRNERFRIVQ